MPLLSWQSCARFQWELVVALLLLPGVAAQAQDDSSDDAEAPAVLIPAAGYYQTLTGYNVGEFEGAARDFQIGYNGSFKVGTNRWVDAICYQAMLGECFYQMGNYAQALEHYNIACGHFIQHNNWLTNVRFPDTLSPAQPGTVKKFPWGPRLRPTRYAQFTPTYLVQLGQVNNNNVAQKGGVYMQATLKPLNVIEIMRCTAVAIRRRREMLGPLVGNDVLSQQIITALGAHARTGHWSQSMINVTLGFAHAAVGNGAVAKGILERNLLTPEGFEHPLTGMALVELGRMALESSDFKTAAALFFEAGGSALQHNDPTIVEEALRYGNLTHMLANGKGVYPPLAAAGAWARAQGYEFVRASMGVQLADAQAQAGRTPAAAAALLEARRAIGRSSMNGGRVGARFQFASALVAYQQAKVTAGDQALSQALAIQKKSSLWLWYIALVDQRFAEQSITPRIAMSAYHDVMREPKSYDWLTEPIEAMGVLVTPHPGVYEHWFQAAMLRKDFEAAVEISELSRRHRFFSSLADGGRLVTLRWMLEGPVEMLSAEDKLEKRDLLGNFPQYTELSHQVDALRAELATLPLVPKDPRELKKQSDLLGALGQASAAQEVFLRQMAVRRFPCRMVFPPTYKVEDFQKKLAPKQAVLGFYATTPMIYGYLISHKGFAVWEIDTPVALQVTVAQLLKQLGHYDGNRPLVGKQLADPSWKATSGSLWQRLTRGASSEIEGQTYDELIIVPDGALWYMPFEALGHGQLPRGKLLIEWTRVRYAPTFALAVPVENRGRMPDENLVAALGRLFPQDTPEAAEGAFANLKKKIPTAVPLASKPLPAPMNLYSSLFDRLVVFDDLKATAGGPFGFAPVPLGADGPGGDFASWLALPWHTPDQLVLPGFHTAAENSLKNVNPALAGADVFLPAFGLMASGSRTVLLSRWRTSGPSSYGLMQEFLQELPHATAAEAWQRSVLVARDAPLLAEREPRIRLSSNEERPDCRHPFFWSGYMVLDTGSPPHKAEPQHNGPLLPESLFGAQAGR